MRKLIQVKNLSHVNNAEKNLQTWEIKEIMKDVIKMRSLTDVIYALNNILEDICLLLTCVIIIQSILYINIYIFSKI